MNFTWALVALFALLAATKPAESKKKITSAFVKSLRQLHRGPPEEPSFSANVQTKWITQKMDNFDDTNNATWKMRYMANENYFKDGGAMFIFIGGEWSINKGPISIGIFTDLAKEHNGILFYTEHRYYGKSKPTNDLSVENLQKYLHVKQALADLAHFIRYQRQNDARLTNSKVIIAGGSYSASMVVWFSKLYPELVNGGWASSAPILAKVDFEEYYEVTGTAILELGSQDCYNRIKNGIAELEALFANKRSAEAKSMLQLCNNFDHNNDLDLWSLFNTISSFYAGIVQHQSEGDVPNHCKYLMKFPDDLTAIGSFFLKKAHGSHSCIDMTYQSSLDDLSKTSYSLGLIRPWYFQTCNEFGWYQTSASRFQPFGTKFPLKLYAALCNDVFGSQYTNERIHMVVSKTNKDFGGLNPKVKNVYMTHGALDPWSAMGHTVKHGASVIPRTSHCADTDSISSNDSDEMRASKERLVELVREWLS